MSELLAFLQIGFRHIVALDAADHMLFLLALAAVYRGRDWRSAVWVLTAFTVGHSITLALAVTGVVVPPVSVIEFLIPVTIVLTGIENLILRERVASGRGGLRRRPVFAAVFGLVHGAGFAGYLRSLFIDDIALPLLGFNLGIELGQIVVLAAATALFATFDRALEAIPQRRLGVEPFRLRLIAVSALVTLMAAGWAAERWPL